MGGAWEVSQAQEPLDPPLHLCLGRRPIGRDQALDLRRGQGQHRHLALTRRQIDYAPGVAHQDSGPRKSILGVEVLNHQEGGGKALQESGDLFVEGQETSFKRESLGGDDNACVEEARPAGPASSTP